jgi:hypothetical protein
MYKVKASNTNIDKSKLTTDGYFKYWLGITPAIYSKSEALKKSYSLGGTIEKVEIIPIKTPLIVEINGSDILPTIRQFMLGRECFISKDNPNKLIYSADIFNKIKFELEYLEKNDNNFKTKYEIMNQLEQLMQLICSDYVLINDMCFS